MVELVVVEFMGEPNNCARLIFTYNRERERFRLRISGFFGSEYLMKLDEIM